MNNKRKASKKRSSCHNNKGTTSKQAFSNPFPKEKNNDYHKLQQPTIFKNPLVVLRYFLLYIHDSLKQLWNWIIHRRSIVLFTSILILFIVYTYQLHGVHQKTFQNIESLALWYSWWIALGIASSVGLGTGLHTFVLFLGPHIAHVTITAYQCKSLAFDVRGEVAFECPQIDDDTMAAQNKNLIYISVLAIFRKIMLESFFWGFGTALGELPPYFVARAAATAGQGNEDLDGINKIKTKSSKNRSLSEKVQLFMFKLMESLGFWGILLAASIPNPLFDLAGIMCGHFSIPFATFFGATFIGKAIMKSSIQSLFIIVSFSKEFIDLFLYECYRISPLAHDALKKVLDEQVQKFDSKSSIKHNANKSTNWVSLIWNGIMISMIMYFVFSTIESLALVQRKKEEQEQKLQNKSLKVDRKPVASKQGKGLTSSSASDEFQDQSLNRTESDSINSSSGNILLDSSSRRPVRNRSSKKIKDEGGAEINSSANMLGTSTTSSSDTSSKGKPSTRSSKRKDFKKT